MTVRRFLFLGAGALARECAALLADIHPQHELACFSDSPQSAAPCFTRLAGSVGEALAKFPPPDWQAVCCIGEPPDREAVHARFRDAGYQFATLRHPNSTSYALEIGAGAVIFPHACLAVGSRLGENVVVNFGAIVGHDTVIGDHSVLTPGVMLSGRVTIGRLALLGIGCSVLPWRKIGDRAIIAAGSSVWTDVPAGATMVGVPAVRREIPGGPAANRAGAVPLER